MSKMKNYGQIIRKYESPIYYQIGGSNIFKGQLYRQAGNGLWNDVARQILPLLGQVVTGQIATTGRDIVTELKSGKPIGESIRTGVKRSYNRIGDTIRSKLRGEGTTRPRRPTTQQVKPLNNRKKSRKKKSTSSRDNFDY